MVKFKISLCVLLSFVILGSFAQESKQERKRPSFAELWKYEIENTEESTTETSRAITAPAIIEEQIVFFASKTGFVFALNEIDGAKIWEFNAGHPISHPFILANGNLFFSTDKEIFCLNKLDGQLVWRKGLGIDITIPLAYYNGALYLITSNNTLYCLGDQNGETRWEYTTDSPVHCPITIYKGILVFGSDSGLVYSILSNNGQLLWQVKLDGELKASPLISDGSMYIGSHDNYIYAVNINSKKLKWKVRTGADIKAPALSWKNYIFVASFDGYLYCFNRDNGHLHYRRSLPARPYNAPLILNNIMYIQTLSNKIIAIAPETGRGLGVYDADNLITSPLSVSEDKDALLFGTNEGTLVALSLKAEKKKADIEGEEEIEEGEEEDIEEETDELVAEEKAAEEIPKTEAKDELLKTEEEIVGEEIGEPFELPLSSVPFDAELHQESMELFVKGNYAGAAIGWAEMIAKLDPQYYTIVIGLYCTSDSLENIYEHKGEEAFIFFIPKPYEGQICYQVCLGLFSTESEVQAKFDQLSEFFQQEKPMITKLGSLFR